MSRCRVPRGNASAGNNSLAARQRRERGKKERVYIYDAIDSCLLSTEWSVRNGVVQYLCVVLCCAQDVISRACTTLSVAPIGRFFFGLKDMKSHCYLSPYLPVPPGNQRYQLRVFVSPAQSNFQFQMVSRSLLQYYYHQVCVSECV